MVLTPSPLAVWGFASAVGPSIGGALASTGHWRWLFYMNIPITAIAIVLVALFFKVKTPQTTWAEKRAAMDYANIIFVASTCAIIIGLTFGGSPGHAWRSASVVVPIIVGAFGLAGFVYVENKWVRNPTLPFAVFRHRNAVCGYVACFTQGILVLILAYYTPIWYQAVLGASAVRSGLDAYALAFAMTFTAIGCGVSITISKRYLWQNRIGWILTIIGLGLMTLLDADSPKAMWIPFSIVCGAGLGTLYTSIRFPTLAPLDVEQHTLATGFFLYARSFGQVIGIVIGATTLSNRLASTLPAAFLEKYGGAGAEVAIPKIRLLKEPLRHEVQVAFAQSLRTIFIIGLGLSFIGLLATLGMEQIEMAAHKDDNWGLQGEAGPAPAVSASSSSSTRSTLCDQSLEYDDKEKAYHKEKVTVEPVMFSRDLGQMDFQLSLA